MSLACERFCKVCDGCLECQEEAEPIGKCWCGDHIHADESYYEIEGVLLHEDCLKDWAKQFRRHM
jgi:hypothetical protein